jgi:CBS domain-containing protein
MSTQMSKHVTVADVMLPLGGFPVVTESIMVKEVLEKMSDQRLGIACIVSSDGLLIGVLTDGDVRRKLLTVQKPFSAFLVDDVITHAVKGPVKCRPEDLLAYAIEIMGSKRIWDLPVVDDGERLVGLLHLHPAVKVLLAN